MAAVVAVADGDVAGVEEGEERVKGGEARGICDGGVFEEYAEDCFEAGCVRGGVPRVDVFILGEGRLRSRVKRAKLVRVGVVAEGGCYMDGW